MAKPVAGVEIGLVDGVLTVNPTKAEMALSTLQLTVAGTKDGILMIEGAANFLPEEIMVDALKIGKREGKLFLYQKMFFIYNIEIEFFMIEFYLLHASIYIFKKKYIV